MMEIRLLIKSPDIWVKDIMQTANRPIKFLDCMPWGDQGGRGLLKLVGTKEENERTIQMIEGHPDIEKVDTSTMKEGGAILTVTTNRCYACRALSRSECFLLSSRTTDEGDLVWNLIAPNDDSVTSLVDELERQGTIAKFLSITPIDHKEVLTTRQLTIIEKAFNEGYYDIPKRITIQKLAKRFKVSPSTLAEILQRGEKKVIGLFIKARQRRDL